MNEGLVEAASEIVAAYVSKNSLQPNELPSFLREVHQALERIMAPQNAPQETGPLVPAVPIKKSITPDFIICLEDGKQYRTLKRTLMASYNLTPDQYRAKWGLPKDYPMVAPSYSARRSEVAKTLGLGRMAGSKVTPVRRKRAS